MQKKRLKILLICMAIVFGGIIAFNLFKAFMIKRFFASYKPPAVSVSAETLREVAWRPSINAVGNFAATRGVDISAQSSGNVIKINFDSGQYVEQNAELITIDDTVDQAVLKFNQSDLALRALNNKRQKDLFKRGAVSISTIDESQAVLDQAQARVDQTQAQINQKHIRAPFSGQLGIRQVNLGQFINPGQTTIVSLQSLDPMYLEFYVPEHLYKKIQLEQNIYFSLEDSPQYLFKAKVSAINSKIESTTHNVLVQGTLANCPASALQSPLQSKLVETQKEGNKLVITCDTQKNSAQHVHQFAFLPGMFASIRIEQPAQGKTLMVPSTAISYSLYGDSVYVIEKQASENKKDAEVLLAKRVFVTTGEQQGNYTVIKKGLKPGQQIVTTGEIKLQNDTPVVINNSVHLHTESQPDAIGQ